MDAKQAYKKTIDSDLERIYSAISSAATSGLQELLYRSNQPFKRDVLDALKEGGYAVTTYAPAPVNSNEVYDQYTRLNYTLGISWYGAK